MKTPRKLTSLLLALLLVFALAATAAADGTDTPATPPKGSITVDNPIDGQTYTAYKIFDVVYDNADHYSYTIKENSEWYNTVKGYAEVEANGLTLTKVANMTPTTYVVTIDDTAGSNKFSAPSFAETLKAAVGGMTGGRQLTVAKGSASIDNLDLGYYFVISNTNALCNLTTTAPNATIHDKNDVPFEKTAPEKSVEVGQKVNYTITGKVPDITGFVDYIYEITDTMSEGLTFNSDSLTVTVGGTAVTDEQCTIDYNTATPNTFKVTIHVDKCKVGDRIEVTYTATVNENAVARVSENNAVLTYSNKPGTNETGKREATPHKVYSAKITINKFWKDGENEKPLENVGFKLYKNGTAENGGADKKLYYVKDTDTGAVTWTEHVDQATQVMTSATGEANFTGLANGTYHLVESKTPAGFNPLTDVKTIKINGSEDGTGLTETVRVENKTGAVLPSTGGMGTTVFYVLGAVLVVGAGVLLVTKKRMSRNEG